MYEQFYGFREKPFSMLPDPAFLYVGRQHRHALTLLEYALTEGSSFALITGEIGSGKTTLIRRILAQRDRPVTFGLITNTSSRMQGLMPWVAQSLGVTASGVPPAELHEKLLERLVDEYRGGRRVVIVVDEAQNLNAAALEELRVLSNLNCDKDLLLQTVLVGQPELRDTLRHPSLNQLAQRIAIDYHLKSLPRAETHAYVRHRLRIAGGSPEIIESPAIELVHHYSCGVPRLINVLCDTALVYGFAEQVRSIGTELVAQVIRDRRAGGILPLAMTPADA